MLSIWKISVPESFCFSKNERRIRRIRKVQTSVTFQFSIYLRISLIEFSQIYQNREKASLNQRFWLQKWYKTVCICSGSVLRSDMMSATSQRILFKTLWRLHDWLCCFCVNFSFAFNFFRDSEPETQRLEKTLWSGTLWSRPLWSRAYWTIWSSWKLSAEKIRI